jgi:hypothetical protein
LSASLDDFRWLISPDGRRWLAEARDDASALQSRLRKFLSAERARLVSLQIELRRRAREKFPLADQMFFTRKGLEQATDGDVAAYKAAKFPSGSHIVDLCCGIGGDLAALARRGKAVGVDLDPICILFAAANVAAYGISQDQYELSLGDATALRLPADQIWHCDPDRRAAGPKTSQLELGAPKLATIQRLLEHNPNAAIKLAPAVQAPSAWQHSAELEWLGSRGETRQQVAWFGSLAHHPGTPSATIVDARGGPRTVRGDASEDLAIAPRLGRFLYEPHSAILAARLIAALCAEHQLSPISPGIVYLTGDVAINDAALDAFEVRDVLPFDRKQLKAYCRQHQIGRLEVKKRGIDLDPARLRKEIIAHGDNASTLLIAPIAGRIQAIIARRLPQTDH